VAIDLGRLLPGRIGGLENAFRGILDGLLARHAQNLEFTPFTSAACAGTLPAHPAVAAPVPLPAGREGEILARELPGHDVVWYPFMFLAPARPPIPAVVSIPDLQHDAHPEFFGREELTARIRRLRNATARAARVLTISEFSRRHLQRVYRLADDRLVVTPLDCGPAFHVPADPAARERLARRLALPANYCLFPANGWPHKNHRTLFRALALCRADAGGPLHAVLTGAADAVDRLAAEARAAGVADLVHHLGFVDDRDLPHLYDGAAMLAFVSLFEGFGIPLVEAMRRGTPILASDTTSVPEVVGDCGLLVDPLDPEAIAGAMREIRAHPAAARARAARGRERAESFSFDAAADAVCAALEAAAAQPAVVPAAARRPKVFVVTPSFNQGRFLRATIDSVLAQDYAEIDYFVADGGSTDDSVAILQSYGDRVRWVSGPDGGQAAAIHRAWRETDAEIVAWLNSDDVYLEGAVRTAVEHLESHPEQSMVYGKAWYIDVDGHRTDPYPTRQPFDRQALAGDCFICQPATFLRREVFQAVDLPDPALQYCMDYDLWIRLSAHFEIGALDRFLAASRMYPENKTLGQRDAVYREIIAVAGRHFGTVHDSWRRGYRSYRFRRTLRRCLWFVPERLLLEAHLALQGYRTRPPPPSPFADGWVGRRTSVRVEPAAGSAVTIRGESPAWPFLVPLRITVWCEGVRLQGQTIARRGPFALRFRLGNRRLAPVDLVVEANRAFVPAARGMWADDRQVAFRLIGVDTSEAAEAG
jgi:glycosyltransferase involved in cell wall biosynthesis